MKSYKIVGLLPESLKRLLVLTQKLGILTRLSTFILVVYPFLQVYIIYGIIE
jgi:hypothetical protein